jgi:hypothetical protein
MRKKYSSQAHDLVPKSLTIPKLGKTKDLQDPMVHVRLFDPAGSWTWFVIEYDPMDRICYGWVCGFEHEFGDFSLAEMESIRGPLGLQVERDLYFQSCRLSQLPRPHRPDIFEE